MISTQPKGTVWLVGAGPGDPELLTLKAARLLAKADIVLYDSLVTPAILDLIPPGCRRIHTGKRCGDHRMPQDRINALMHRNATRYRTVVRLKGGDPFIFGRGGEEMQYLRERGVAVEIVPGITAAAGCAASVQIPLTHRDYGDALMVRSGHSRKGGFGKTREYTRVFYMGLGQAAGIQREMIDEGACLDTAVAIITGGTTPDEKMVTGTLGQLPDLARSGNSSAPGLIIIGSAVALARDHRRSDSDTEVA